MRILFIDRSTLVEDVFELEKRPRGGTVNSLFEVTDYLSSVGHYVEVLSDIEQPSMSRYGTMWENEPTHDKWDVIVCNRGIGDGYPMFNAKKRILWTHDLVHAGFIPTPKMMQAFHTVFMSRYSMQTWKQFYKHISEYTIIPNGVDPSIYSPVKDRDFDKVVYFSHPNRGLSKLPIIADTVNAKLQRPIEFIAYSNKSMYPNEKNIDIGDIEFKADYESDKHLKIEQPITKLEMRDKIGNAGLMVMPTGLPETCSNSILQSLAFGIPVVTTGGLGSAQEFVKHRQNGMLTKRIPNDYMVYTHEVIKILCEVLSNKPLYSKLVRGAKNTRILSWLQVGQKWDKLISR